MQVFTAKNLDKFELEVAHQLVQLGIDGYALVGFKFFNYESVEITGLLISEDGLVCCLEIKDYAGTWSGRLDGVWQSEGKEIRCRLANNPWQQLKNYVLVIQNLLLTKLSRAVAVNGIVVIPNAAEIQIQNVSVDRFNRSNPLTVCHLANLELVINEIQATFKQPYENGRADRWLYALTGFSEVGLSKDSVAIAESIWQVNAEIQGAVNQNQDLTEQILSELISLRENGQRIEQQNTSFNRDILDKLATSSDTLQHQNQEMSAQFASGLNNFQGKIQEQNSYLIRQLVNELIVLKDDLKTQNEDLVKNVTQELDSLKTLVKDLTEQNISLYDQTKRIENILTKPNWWQRLFLNISELLKQK